MERFPDWPQRLRVAIEERRNTAHAWGVHGCATCAADLVAAQTGRDFAANFRGRYSDEEGAHALLADMGHADLPALVDTLLPRRDGRIQRGDVLWHPGVKGDFLAIAWSGGIVAPGPSRLLVWPIRKPSIIWAGA